MNQLLRQALACCHPELVEGKAAWVKQNGRRTIVFTKLRLTNAACFFKLTETKSENNAAVYNP